MQFACCRKSHGADAKSCFAEAEQVLEELAREYGWVQADGSAHLASNVAVVLSAIKPKA